MLLQTCNRGSINDFFTIFPELPQILERAKKNETLRAQRLQQQRSCLEDFFNQTDFASCNSSTC